MNLLTLLAKLWRSLTQKKTLKIEIKLFIDLHFQLPKNFCFSDYVTNTPISVQLWAGPFNGFLIFPGSPHTLQTSYPPTSFYRLYFIFDNVLLIKASRKIPLKMWPLYLLMYLEMSNERILTSIFTVFTPWFLQIGSNQAEIFRDVGDKKTLKN